MVKPFHCLFWFSICVAGCGQEDTEPEVYGEADSTDLLNTEPDTGFDDGSGNLGNCDTVYTKINGRLGDNVANPRVGDDWIVRMYCDGAFMTGANRLFFQPAGVAVVDDVSTDATFIAQGSSTMTMQSGNFIFTKTLTVQAAQ